MSEELTKKQKGFADEYLETGNGTQAALNNYDTDNEHTAAVIASENLRKPDIRQYLEDNANDAASRIVELSKGAENETVRLNANKDILDRAGYKPIEKTDITTKGEKLTTSSNDIEAIAKRVGEELKKNKSDVHEGTTS